ncbi:MAG: hypothetical protein IJ371_00355 [Clostridia bacterium]|nr:hypothetical protein [Clostridia bacterium]
MQINKKVIFIIIITLQILFAVAINTFALTTATTVIKYKQIDRIDDEIIIWKDPETDVQYIIYKGYRKGGITPRLNNDGTPYITQD